ncbi:double homeobox protein B [Mesocricetus auratus]|uniref:Double homeobox protein B n=1 Tax=Mesocricetus auratus TaxID=10036 RepID=A0ABM2WR69_MESAU|nr:double homeobox protein B [Mesocricetus auratus]
MAAPPFGRKFCRESLQPRVTYTQSQKNILQEWYEHNPYPDADTLKQLTKILHVPGSKIKIWFNNYRKKQKILEQVHSEARPHQAPFTRAQESFLRNAFQKNRLPDRAARKIMAIKIGIKESKIKTWFQNQRILNPEHREEPMNLSDGTNGVPHPTAQEQHIRLVPPPACCFPSSKPCCNEQMSLPAPLESQAFVPPGSVGVFGSPESGTATLQAPEAVQEGQNPDAPLTYTNHLPEQPIIGQGSSGAQAPFCSQLDADHGRQQPEDPDHIDVSYVMQWWDKGRLDLIAKWEPQKET